MAEPNRRVVASGLTVERPEYTTRVDAECDLFTTLVLAIGRPMWGMRVEIGLLGVAAAYWAMIAYCSDWFVATVTTAVAVAGVLVWSTSRNWLFRALRIAYFRRTWDTACRYAFLATMNDRTPKPLKIRETPAGFVLDVQMPPSMSTLPLVDAAEILASGLCVREVKVERFANRADRAKVSVIRRDPLGGASPVAWPNATAARLSVWEPIPVGFDELGEVVSMRLPEKMVLVGAETGAGKSVCVSQLVATAALDPDCQLTLLDGKQVELAFWRECAERVVGPSLVDAIDTLLALQTEMDRRYAALLHDGRRKISRDDGVPLHVVVCDELAFYFTMGERAETKEFERLFRDLVARGRAAGIIVIAATQKPSHDIIPTSVRDLFAVRWALRCTTPQASDTVLGQGWASQGFSAAEIDQSCRGVGYLLHEGEVPVRLRSYYLSDEDLRALARRAVALRNVQTGSNKAAESAA